MWKKGSALVPVVHRLQRRDAARAALPRPGRLRVHRPHGGRPRRDRRRQQEAGAVAERSTSATADGQGVDADPGSSAWSASARRDRRARDQLDPARRRPRTASRSWPASAATARTSSAARTPRQHPRRHRARRAHASSRRSSCSTRRRATGALGNDPETGLSRARQGRPVRPLRAARASRRRAEAEAQDARRCSRR